MARGSAAASSSNWWSARGPERGADYDDENRGEVPPPAADHKAAPSGPRGGRIVPADSNASPPGLDDDAERGGAASGTGTHALDAEGAVARPSGSGNTGHPGGRAACAAELTEGDLGQVDGAAGSQSRHGSPGPVVPSHCEGDTTAIGGARPDGSQGGASGEGPSLGHDSVPGAYSDVEAHGDRVLLLPLGAVCVGGGASAVAQQDPGSGRCGTADGRPGGIGVAHHDDAVQVKLEVGAHPSSPGADAPADTDASGEALPVPSDADDGEARLDTGGDQPPEGASGADDGLPSFSPVDEAPVSPAGTGDASFGTTAAPASPGDKAPTAGDDLPLLSLAGGGRGVGGSSGGTRTPEAGDGGRPSCVEAAGPGGLPHGVVSPPATTVFGGGIGVALGAGGCGNANVAHSVEVSESESDLGASPPVTTAAAEAAAMADPEGVPSPSGPESALQ